MSLDVTPAELMIEPVMPRHPAPLRKATLWIMSIACGASAANIYYNQPLLGRFAEYFHSSPSTAGLVSTASQVGYGLGILLFVPLGDIVERRKVLLILIGACILFLLGAAIAPDIATLIVLQFLIGITSMNAQLLIPFAIDLTPIEDRGRTVGSLMAGLLSGVLLARTVSGFVGDWLGWRAMFAIAAAIMMAMGVVLHFTLPHRPPTMRMGYGKLMHSMFGLLRTQKALWSSSILSALSFGAFSAFWTTLSFLMADHFHRGATEAGLFGVIGIVGAMAAPLAGKLSDRKGAAFTVTIALVATIAAFMLIGWIVTIPSLIVGVLLLDMGVQSVQVAAQSHVMAILPEARNRMNTLYMVCRFGGGAAGSIIGAAAWTHVGWGGACTAAIVMLALAMGVHLVFESE